MLSNWSAVHLTGETVPMQNNLGLKWRPLLNITYRERYALSVYGTMVAKHSTVLISKQLTPMSKWPMIMETFSIVKWQRAWWKYRRDLSQKRKLKKMRKQICLSHSEYLTFLSLWYATYPSSWCAYVCLCLITILDLLHDILQTTIHDHNKAQATSLLTQNYS